MRVFAEIERLVHERDSLKADRDRLLEALMGVFSKDAGLVVNATNQHVFEAAFEAIRLSEGDKQ